MLRHGLYIKWLLQVFPNKDKQMVLIMTLHMQEMTRYIITEKGHSKWYPHYPYFRYVIAIANTLTDIIYKAKYFIHCIYLLLKCELSCKFHREGLPERQDVTKDTILNLGRELGTEEDWYKV